MSYTLSPNMFLRIPSVGADEGPDYAININYDLLNIIDTHDHTTGRGAPLTPLSFDINTNLSFNNHFATDLAGLTLIAQSITPTTGTVYRSVNDLFFVDGLGNNIRITQAGGIAGTPGSISGLVAPASATYSPGSQTFVWQSNINIAANMDAGSLLLRNLSPNSTFALTLQPPAALASNYAITLPLPPAGPGVLSPAFMVMDYQGTITTGIPTAGGIVAANVSPTAGILGTQLSASANILGSQLSAAAGINSNQLSNTTVVAGSYGHASITVNAQGQITTAASNVVAAGTYTPTITAITGGGTVTPELFQFQRIEAVITVSGILNISATAGQTCKITMPAASNFTAETQAVGLTSKYGGTGTDCGTVAAVTSTQTAILTLINTSGTAGQTAVHFTYRVIP